MIHNCPRIECKQSSIKSTVHLHGVFFRKSDSRHIVRFLCTRCKRTFSSASFSECVNQKKRRINPTLRELMCAGVTMRRSARILGVNRKTVAWRLPFLSQRAKLKHDQFLAGLKTSPLKSIQFDELETSEHTKCKPLSVALAVEPKTRKMLGFQVSSMPANGLLAAISRKKYGPRRDDRRQGLQNLFNGIAPMVTKTAQLLSDECPRYPTLVKQIFPDATHATTPGRRGCSTGQGELKRIGFDPLFSLNHTCAMLRANISRLIRRTWSTTKKAENLAHHLMIYMNYHNECLTPTLRLDA